MKVLKIYDENMKTGPKYSGF